MTLDRDEVQRRMPAVALIDDDRLRRLTVDHIAEFPEYFWRAPATSSDRYHNRYARDDRGLWIHVLMSATALERVVDSPVEQGDLSDREADMARAAVLLHDGQKYGTSWRPGQSAASDHDLLMAATIRQGQLPEPVAAAVASHMGPWYDGPEPETPLQRLVHQADMMASARHVEPAVYDAPEELVAVHPDLPRCGFDDAAPVRGSQQQPLAEFGGGDEG